MKKFFKRLFLTILLLIFIPLSIIGIWFLVNGGIQLFGTSINTSGFFSFLGDFFVSLWEGIKAIFV